MALSMDEREAFQENREMFVCVVSTSVLDRTNTSHKVYLTLDITHTPGDNDNYSDAQTTQPHGSTTQLIIINGHEIQHLPCAIPGHSLRQAGCT